MDGLGPRVFGISALIGVIGLADQPRDEIRPTLERLRSLGIKALIMLTGDNERTAKAIAQQVGIERVLADVLPQEKAHEIKKLQQIELQPYLPDVSRSLKTFRDIMDERKPLKTLPEPGPASSGEPTGGESESGDQESKPATTEGSA